MGYLSSTQKTTSQSKTAPLSQEGLEYQAQMNSIILQLMDSAGYEAKTEEKTKYADPSKASNIQNQITGYETRIQNLQNDLKINPAVVGVRANKSGDSVISQDPRQREIESLQASISKAQDSLNQIPQTTYTDFSFNKKPDPRLQNAIDKFGANSAEANQIKEQIKGEELYSAEAKADIARTYLEKSKKLVNGDYSYTNEQKAVAESYFAPIRDTISQTTDLLINEADQNQANLFQYVDQYMDQINQTGIDVKDALDAALVQVNKSGQELMAIVQNVNDKYEAKAKFEFDLLSKQADEKAASQSALLGLPPGSMVEKKQAAAMKYNALQSVLLGLEADAANRTLGVASQTESEKKAISLSGVDLALSQGGKKENLSGTMLNIAGQTGAQKMGIKGAYAENLLGLEKDKMNLLYNSAAGQLPQQMAGAQGFLGFDEQQQSNDINQLGAVSAPISHGLDIEQQRTFGEAKNTSKQTSSGSIFGAITGGIAAVTGAASAYKDIFGGGGEKAAKG